MINLINPVRAADPMPNFTMAKSRLREGWAVNVALDLNVIAKMERCVFDHSTPAQEGLSNFIELVPDGGVVLVPGFAILEVSAEFSARARAGYEAFISQHLPSYVDTPGTTYSLHRDQQQTRHYDDAPRAKRLTISRTYIAMLLLLIVSEQANLSPEDKFGLFIDRMAKSAGVIGILEARAAQFVLFDRSKVPSGPWSQFCRPIRANFLKSRGSREKVRLNAFNQAHDLNLIRAATSAHGVIENRLRNDYWVAADDQGLSNLCSTFRFSLGEDGFYDGRFVFVDNMFDELVAPGYWETTNNLLQGRHIRREEERRSGISHELDYDQLEASVEFLHREIETCFQP